MSAVSTSTLATSLLLLTSVLLLLQCTPTRATDDDDHLHGTPPPLPPPAISDGDHPDSCSTACLLRRVRRRVALMEDNGALTARLRRTMTAEREAVDAFNAWNWERIKAREQNRTGFLAAPIKDIVAESLTGQKPMCKIGFVVVERLGKVIRCLKSNSLQHYHLPMESWQGFSHFAALRFLHTKPGPVRKAFICYTYGHRYRKKKDSTVSKIKISWTFGTETSDIYYQESSPGSSQNFTRTTTPAGGSKVTAEVAFDGTGMAGHCVGIPNDQAVTMTIEDAQHMQGIAMIQQPNTYADLYYTHLDQFGFLENEKHEFVRPGNFKAVPLVFRGTCKCPAYFDPQSK